VTTPPDRHTFGPVEFNSSVGPIKYEVELSIGEIDTDGSHSIIMMTAVMRGEQTVATLHHVDRVEIKDVDMEVEEDLRDE
jgi:hypothetical protein